MITVDELKKKAHKAYMHYLSALILGETNFPIIIPFNKNVSDDFITFQEEWNNLYPYSKNKLGYGFIITFREVKKKTLGNQSIPEKIYFETEEDLLRFLRKNTEAAHFKKNIAIIMQAFPMLKEWLTTHIREVIIYDTEWKDLLQVLTCFQEHPIPNLYIRELPVEVHTKFIENHKTILKSLLNVTLKDSLVAEESVFEKRFHLKTIEPLVRLRILDDAISQQHFKGLNDLALPISQCALLSFPVEKIFVVENRINFLTFPSHPQSILLWGKGYEVSDLKQISLLQKAPIYYWGDLDVQGFEILSQMRGYFPHTTSILMNQSIFDRYFQHDAGEPSNVKTELHLTVEEYKLYELLKKKNWRLEQEKIPQKEVYALLEQL